VHPTDVNKHHEADLLTAHGLTKIYPPRLEALRDVNFTIRRGEIVGLLGANGSGKSTFAKILTGVEAPTSGVLLWDGNAVTIESPAAARRMGCAMVYQELNLLPNLTAAENVLLANSDRVIVGHFSREAARQLYSRHAAILPEAPNPDDRVGDLTVGQRQKVAIIRALAQNPKLLIIDEGTSSWNQAERVEFQEILKTLVHKHEIAVIYITHFIDDALTVSDRLVIFRDGNKVVDAAAVADLSTEDIVHAISGPLADQQRPRAPSPEEETKSSDGNSQEGLDVRSLLTRGAGPISFKVAMGECVGFYGYPGCGASETLEAIAGLRTHRGIISWNGAQLRGDIARRLKRNVVFCTGDRGRQVIARWPVYMNVALPRLFTRSLLRGMPRRQFLQLGEQLVEKYGVKGDATTLVGALSGGNQQKALVASALEMGRPLLLLGDDLARGIDAPGRADLYDIIRRTMREEVAMILWTTDPHDVKELCSRVLIFSGGQVVQELAASEITATGLDAIARVRVRSSVDV
jgi:ribose transport system ATP-binding protein